MTKVAVIGASGRLGHEVVTMIQQHSPAFEILATYNSHEVDLAGVETYRVDLNEREAVKALSLGCDYGIDCSGPSERFGRIVSEIFSQSNTPLISLGHGTYEQARNQIYRSGALPGILSAAFTLLDGDFENYEVLYCFNGVITPSAAEDILAGTYRDADFQQASRPRSICAQSQKCIPFFEEDISYLAKFESQSVDSFSLWPRPVLETFGPAQIADSRRGANLLSLASVQTVTSDETTRIYVFGNPGIKDCGKLIEIPSMARLSAAAAWYALVLGRIETLDKATSLIEVLGSHAANALREVLVLSGARLQDAPDCESLFIDDFEEGSL